LYPSTAQPQGLTSPGVVPGYMAFPSNPSSPIVTPLSITASSSSLSPNSGPTPFSAPVNPTSPTSPGTDIHDVRKFYALSGVERVRIGTFAFYSTRAIELKECALLIKDASTFEIRKAFEFSRGKVQLSRTPNTFKIVNASSEVVYVSCSSEQVMQSWVEAIKHNLQAELALDWSTRTRGMKLWMVSNARALTQTPKSPVPLR